VNAANATTAFADNPVRLDIQVLPDPLRRLLAAVARRPSATPDPRVGARPDGSNLGTKQ